MYEVKEYNSSLSKDLFYFRRKVLEEGNDSLKSDKFNPDTLDGKIWCVYINNVLASVSVVESSHYTGDPDVAARVCRYHILKEFRHSHCGFRMLPYQIQWAKEKGYKVLYWTHDVKNRALNALYQHKRRMTDPESKHFFESDWYKQVKFDKRWLFEVDTGIDFLQYVYYIDLQNENYVWMPKKCAKWL
jgi:GNAT superfamily N-acetyltransferase